MRRFVRENGLALGFGFIFLAALVGQAIVGHAAFNDDAIAHHGGTMSLWRYVTSSSFGSDVMENWQSEYLQFTLFILGTIWLLQRGSPESKELDKAGQESDEEQKVGPHADSRSPRWARVGGLRTRLYQHSLLLVMGAIWLGTWVAQTVTGHVAYDADQLSHRQPPVSLVGYVGTADFWNRTLQNWQSEFLAVGSMAILSVYLRARGSPESKPVGAPHEATGVEG
ncbi:MAG: hypothetical protein QOE65_745 [Solirubrobacteraceae bacterium]|nr:hypothetical protein [Solirubrobacteraceae bacterium]